jgi:hypothetical protein
MFQQDLSKPFIRIMGCTARELRDWLDRSLPGARLTKSAGDGDGHCAARFDDGDLRIDWLTLEPRRRAVVLRDHSQSAGRPMRPLPDQSLSSVKIAVSRLLSTMRLEGQLLGFANLQIVPKPASHASHNRVAA